MLYDGSALSLALTDNDLCVMTLDLEGESVNKMGQQMLADLVKAIEILETHKSVKGLMIKSAKEAFIVGADIGEFLPLFAQGSDAVYKLLGDVCDTLNRIEALPFPTVVAVNGYALGGGMEFCLSCDYRVASEEAKLGLPETKLGIIPGWGGTVRLPRLAGVDTAIEWIASGKDNKAADAFKAGVVDAVVSKEKLHEVAIATLKRAVDGDLDYPARRAVKNAALKHNDIESLMAFESAKAFVKGQAGRNYPAPVTAVQVMQDAAKMDRTAALKVEADAFAKLAAGPVARSLVGLFINDQSISRTAKNLAKKAGADISTAAVLGAGIMGGGIAYQSACKNVPIVMKDIAQEGLDAGMAEAKKLLLKQIGRGKIDAAAMADTLARIKPVLSYDNFDKVDVIVEAVVENPKVKSAVLSEAEKRIADHAVLCTNTSTISVNSLAKGLTRPDKFCGMHFFNPVHRMPLVEIIRGEQSSESTIASVVAFALKLGKKPIVVNDCPGFLVNRVLFPYFAGFTLLIRDGADFQQVDKVMSRWGWPMGPAHLLDVVGIDTAVHAEKVMAAGFPDRMTRDFKACTEILFEADRYGQKKNGGFYHYSTDKKGKPVKTAAEQAIAMFPATKEFTDEEIIMRMMIPMATELVRCLDEGIVETVAEADMALIYGLGFPPFRGGVFRWLDELGLDKFLADAQAYAGLGGVYDIPGSLKSLASSGGQYYPKV